MKKLSPYDKKGVAERLKQLRRATGLTMTEVSRQSGVSFSQLSKIEVAQGHLGMDSLVRLAEYYRIPKEWILSGKDDGTAPARAARGPGANGNANLASGDALLLRICQASCDPDVMAKARVIANTLNCPLPEGLAIVIRQASRADKG